MSYGLARLRRNGSLARLPHSNNYVLTEEGQRVAISTPRCMTDSSGRCSRRTPHQPRPPPELKQDVDVLATKDR